LVPLAGILIEGFVGFSCQGVPIALVLWMEKHLHKVDATHTALSEMVLGYLIDADAYDRVESVGHWDPRASLHSHARSNLVDVAKDMAEGFEDFGLLGALEGSRSASGNNLRWPGPLLREPSFNGTKIKLPFNAFSSSGNEGAALPHPCVNGRKAYVTMSCDLFVVDDLSHFAPRT
jgi:hypothetical protein